jgi:hypothetical protein
MRHPRKLVNGRTKPFFWMLNEVIDNGHLARLGPNTFAVYAVLHRWSEKNDEVEMSIDALCKQTGMARNTARKAVRRLLRLHYLRRSKRAGGTVPTVYLLIDPPEGGQTVTPRGSNRDPLEGQNLTPSPPPVQISDLRESKREIKNSSSNNRSSAKSREAELREEQGERLSSAEVSAAAALLEGVGIERDAAKHTARCAWGFVGSDGLMARISDVITFGQKGLDEGKIKRTLASYVIAALQKNYTVTQRKPKERTAEEKKREAEDRVKRTVAEAEARHKTHLEAEAKVRGERERADAIIAEAPPEEVVAAVEQAKRTNPMLAKATLLASPSLTFLVAGILKGHQSNGDARKASG